MSKFKAILFDMDGTLIDSELHWINVEKKFGEIFNIPYSREWTKLVNGRSLMESSKMFKELHNLPHSVEEILAHKDNCSEAVYTDHALPLVGADDLLRRIKKQADKKTAIASGASLDRIKKIVDRFSWQDYFDALISTDHVDYIGKPDPAIFLYAAQELGISPSECVVIEDSENGFNAAKRAGMKCVVKFDDRWSNGDFSGADLIVNSLDDKKIYDFLGIKYA
ncbi:MAG: HAD family phosphatase [Patescibacteria group bacterium]